MIYVLAGNVSEAYRIMQVDANMQPHEFVVLRDPQELRGLRNATVYIVGSGEGRRDLEEWKYLFRQRRFTIYYGVPERRA
jgi:hypothetical protein